MVVEYMLYAQAQMHSGKQRGQPIKSNQITYITNVEILFVATSGSSQLHYNMTSEAVKNVLQIRKETTAHGDKLRFLFSHLHRELI